MRATAWRVREFIAVVGLVLVVTACDATGPGCESSAVTGISLTVIDSIGGGPVDAPDVFAKASEGLFADSLRVSPTGAAQILALVIERAGTYVVDVSANGYEPWSRSGVRVIKDESGCHVQNVRITAKMRRS